MKSILINKELHERFKVFCRGKNLKIGGKVESLVAAYIKDNKKMDKLINEIINGK